MFIWFHFPKPSKIMPSFIQRRSFSSRLVGVGVKLISLVILGLFVDAWPLRERCFLATDSICYQSRTGGEAGGNQLKQHLVFRFGWVFLFGSTESAAKTRLSIKPTFGREKVLSAVLETGGSGRKFGMLLFPNRIYLSFVREAKVKVFFRWSLSDHYPVWL